MTTTTQIPDFKLAKVGKKRERKKAGLFWRLGGGDGASFLGATGGTAVTVMKAAVLALIAAAGVGAYNVGVAMAPNAALSKPKYFAAKDKTNADTAAASVGPAPASGLAMVSGSLDGKTPEERAADAAAAAAAADAAAKAEADRKAQEEADAKKAADAQAQKGAAAPDPAALLAAAQKPGGGSPFDRKFGALSSTLGAGHSGLTGGAGLSGGVGRAFSAMPSLSGKSEKQAAPATPSRAAAKAHAVTGHSGRAFRQALHANTLGRQARNGTTSEDTVSAADAAFENNPGAGSAITGGGAGQGGAGAGDHAPGSTNPNTSGPTGCAGDCSGGAPSASHVDASPWRNEIKIAAGLTILASLLLIVAAVISNLKFPQAKLIAEVLGVCAAALGAVVLGMGASIMSKGGPGMMYVVSGGLITLGGVMVALSPTKTSASVAGISHTVIMYGAIFAGLLGGAQGLGSYFSAGASTSSSQ